MTKTKIKVVGGEKNTKTLGELEVRDVFESCGGYWVKSSEVDGHCIICFDVDRGFLANFKADDVPEIVYRKMKVKLYE